MTSRLFLSLVALLGGAIPLSATQPVWTNDTPAGPPSARYDGKLVDEGNGKLLLFGGFSNGAAVGDTYEFNGTTWSVKSPATSPPPRYQHAMASEGNGKVILYGGFNSTSGILGDTWEWNGTTWTQLSPAHTPGLRDGHAMATESTGKLIVFGGRNSGGMLTDTWEWNGTDWTQKATGGPAARYNHSMSDEGGNGSVLLFGGSGASGALADTWEWNGTSWTQKATSGPSARYNAGLAYDVSGKVLLFGGLDPNSANLEVGDTWEWSGSAWTQRSPAMAPPARTRQGMAYDATLARTVMFGGTGVSGALNDTYLWDGTNWTLVTASTANPSTRYGHSLADEGGGKILLFGGYNGTLFNDTWRYNGTAWTQLSPATSPGARYEYAMAAEGGGKVLIFGGNNNSGTLLGDTWEWNGTTWTQKSTTGPAIREGAAMAVESNGNVLLFGGGGASIYSDTWEWNGTTWTQKSPAHSPPARNYHRMVYESATGKILLFGGEPSSGYLNDTWEWNGTDWTQLSPAVSPSVRALPGLAYDSVRQRVVLFGGQTTGQYLQDVWEFNGTTWTNLTPPTLPPVRTDAGMAYDASFGPVGKVILFGGNPANGALNDTWDYDGTAPTFTSFALTGSSPVISGNNVGFTATFSEAITGVDATDFSFVTTGNVAGPLVVSVSTSGAVATVTASTGTGGGTLALKLTDDDTIRDLYGYPIGGPGTGATFTSAAYTITGKPNANNGSANVAHNTATPLTLSATDTNSPAQTLTYAIATNPAHGTLSGFNASTGAVTYTPTSGYHGSDSFTFTASNTGGATSNAATETLTVAAGTPVATAQSGVSVAHDTAKAITLAATDDDSPAPSFSYAIATNPSHGTLSNFNASTGAVTYAPSAGYHGADSFTFTASNGTNTSAAATVSLTVAVGTPIATAQSVTTAANTAKGITLAANDNDTPVLTLTYTVVANPAHGTLSGTAPNLTYTPASNYAGSDSFNFTASNGTNTSAAATVSITVTGFAPSITSLASVVFTAGRANTFTVTTTGAPNAALSESGALPSGVTFTDNGNGTATLSGTPAAGATGNYPLTITANNGISPNATQNFSLVLNRPPTVSAASLGATQNTSVQVSVAKLLAYASDADGDPLSVASVSTVSAQNGTLLLSAPGSTGTITYTPASNFVGSDSFTYVVSDGRGGTVTGTVNVTVSSANDHTLNVVSITKTAATVTVVYAGIPGDTYQPQYAPTLDGGPWTSDGPPLTAGSNGQFIYVDTTQPQPTQRFYRAIAVP